MTERESSRTESEILLKLFIRRAALFAYLEHPTLEQTLTAQKEAGIIDGEIKRLCEIMPPIKEVSGK